MSKTQSVKVDDKNSEGSAGPSESAYNFSQRQQGSKLVKDIAKLLNDILELLKNAKWDDVSDTDKSVVLGLFAVLGGWQGFSRICSGSQVSVETSNGVWNSATVIDDGVGKNKVSVILDDDVELVAALPNGTFAYVSSDSFKATIRKTELSPYFENKRHFRTSKMSSDQLKNLMISENESAQIIFVKTK